ncbi:hypothetical protein ACPPVT_00155 [Angustibacter sp. McL0619]|uniref:hypothetical protein n=1 Tax=Angustibacter sp. McL0619 TaxID=3415676 RepID=UPI003CF8C57C
MTQQEMSHAKFSAQKASAKKAAAAYVAALRRPTFESTVSPGCPGNDPNRGVGSYDMACAYMTNYCRARGLGDGWLTWIWRRPVNTAGHSTVPWQRAGFSCRVPAAVLASVRPGLTQDVLRRAFARLAFAKPQVHVQPEGNITLVNLPTYYEVRWPAAGYQPNEVATLTLLGRTVQIRPVAASYTYTFGDGANLGPTPSPGGTYPGGDVRHTYTERGQAPVHVRASYTGQYRLAGGAWQDIELTVPVGGPVVEVQVKEAHAVLIDGNHS